MNNSFLRNIMECTKIQLFRGKGEGHVVNIKVELSYIEKTFVDIKVFRFFVDLATGSER